MMEASVVRRRSLSSAGRTSVEILGLVHYLMLSFFCQRLWGGSDVRCRHGKSVLSRLPGGLLVRATRESVTSRLPEGLPVRCRHGFPEGYL